MGIDVNVTNFEAQFPSIIPFYSFFAFLYSKQFSPITGTLAASKISRINNCIQKQYSTVRTQTKQFSTKYVTLLVLMNS